MKNIYSKIFSINYPTIYSKLFFCIQFFCILNLQNVQAMSSRPYSFDSSDSHSYSHSNSYSYSYSYSNYEMFKPRASIKQYIPITEPDSRRAIRAAKVRKYNQTPPELLDKSKNNYTFSPFGRLAFKEQAKLIQGVKFLEGCAFPEKSYTFKAQQAVQFIFRNENEEMIHLIFSPKNLSEEQKYIDYKLKEDEAVNFHHVKIKPKNRRVWYWQFNKAKDFEWLCYDQDLNLKSKVKIFVRP